MRTVTCLFFAVVSVLLGDIANGVGVSSDPLPRLAGLVFVLAAAGFALADWPRGESKAAPDPVGPDR
jgi:hypothetical protein